MARQQRSAPLPMAWEYQEFRVPESDRIQTLFSWLRDGWEFVGFHLKTNTVKQEVPVVIMRRERADGAALARE
ncbi:MAG TPA: hypothetical protein VK457_14740 [Chloroflexota bacterium]|nr:hypothetical protein [Chloroflexota bacterium]